MGERGGSGGGVDRWMIGGGNGKEEQTTTRSH